MRHILPLGVIVGFAFTLTTAGCAGPGAARSDGARTLIITNDSSAFLEIQLMHDASQGFLVEPGAALSTTFVPPSTDPREPAASLLIVADGSPNAHRADLFAPPYELRISGSAGDLRLSRPPSVGEDRRVQDAIGTRGAPPAAPPESGLPR